MNDSVTVVAKGPPGRALDLIQLVKAEVNSVIEHYRSVVADSRLSFAEGWELASRAVASFVRVVSAAGAAFADADQKEAVLAAAGEFYDRVIAPLNIPWVPDFVERSVVDPAMRLAFLQLAGGLADTFARVFARERAARAGCEIGGFLPY